ncbi:hypothetical protein G6O67_001757 [Ophiocordyceps sinensis]|uniref:Secondary alcohol dehydrogenase n=1 Tax=Ophiocordyceps sinensis TaxID=72228 RepID=A0A8H4V989_9HYPO|nr:hypothetical protein G6O67_001757 [Ophiocordyceps sinensis]
MSSADTHPIAPARFAAALEDLDAATLHLKVLEMRNSVAHLQYSNDQLRPFAEGSAGAGPPDPDCVDAIAENDVVIDRMARRVALVRAEVERRGLSWAEFRGRDDDDDDGGDGAGGTKAPANGASNGAPDARHAAWSDGTFQTGSMREGQVRLDAEAGTGGGSLSDEQLRRAVEEQLRNLGHDDDGGGNDGGDGGVHL